MTDTQIAGVDTSISYAYEAPEQYNELPSAHEESDETYVAFGRRVDVTVSRSQNKQRVYEVGNRNAVSSVNTQYSGNVSVNGILSNAYWLLGVLGKNTDAGTLGAYTHTYTEEDVQPTITIKRTMNFGSTQGTETMVGGVINNGTIRAAVNEPVTFSLEIPYRYEVDPDESTTPEIVIDTNEVFIFSGATIETPSGTTLSGIDNFEINFNNTVDLEFGAGTRYAEAVTSKNREYNIRYTASIKDYSNLKRFLAGSEVATLEMSFENSVGDTLVLSFEEFHVNEDNLPTNPTEVVKEDCTGWAHKLTSAVYTNATEHAPKQAS